MAITSLVFFDYQIDSWYQIDVFFIHNSEMQMLFQKSSVISACCIGNTCFHKRGIKLYA